MRDPEETLRKALLRPARPSSDFDLNPAITLPPGRILRPAAVLLAVWPRPDGARLILTKRASHLKHHPGQIAFPGGKVDPGESAEEAALREAWEELAIPPEKVRVIGTGDVYRAHSGFEITPVLATVPADLEIIPNPTEVAQWFEPPVAHMLDPANHAEKWVEWEGGMRPYYEILWREHNTWGVTAAIIVNLAKRLGWHG